MPCIAQNVLLVVDDDQELLALIAEIGKRCGYSVLTAASAAEFREAIASYAPSVVILDLQLCDMDGVEALRQLATVGAMAEVLLLSGMDIKVLATARQIGMSLGLHMPPPLQKPVRLQALENYLLEFNGEHLPLSAAEFRRALAEYELVLHYQPILRRAEAGWVVGAVEALVRWQHPKRGLLYPSEFLALVEKADLMTEMTDFVLTEALRQVGHWQARGLQLGLAVNLAAHTVADLNFPDRLAGVLREYGVQPEFLCFEVTEAASVLNADLVMDNFARLRVRGIELALDDFGTGTSSVTQLYQMPYSIMKIDHRLIAEMSGSQQARTVVSALIDLGHKLSLAVCAEGVESQLAFDRLEHMGCNQLQGDYICRPVPAVQLETFVRDWELKLQQSSALLAG